MDRSAPASVDLVIPIYNEESVLPALLRRLDQVFSPAELEARNIARVRYRFVDDGSRDRSAEILARHAGHPGRVVVYRLSRNFGHANAVSAGLDHADADVVAVMDADLQDPPEVVLEMLDRWREGIDVVFAQRRNRKENILKRAGYWIFYRFVALLSDLDIPLDSGDFCLMDRRVVDAMRSLPERLRFPRILRTWVGFEQAGVEYERPERAAGSTKYGFWRLYQLATDGIASSSIRLLRVAQLFSFSFAILTAILLAVLFVALGTHADRPQSLLILGGLILIAGGNFVITTCLYILGAYVGRTYLEAKGRPPYLIMEIVGEETPPDGGDASTRAQGQ
jgi:glycosyltransferase involved in cell wall biosynthesis